MDARTLTALTMSALLVTTGCLGLFGDDEEEEEIGSTEVNPSLGNETVEELQRRSASEFQNYTVPGQEALPSVTKWFNGTIGPGQGAASFEDRNDRTGNNYNTPTITNDLSEDIPPGQPALIKAKVWWFAQPGSSSDLDIYANVPGTQTEFAGDNCDEFSWKVCVQEMTLSTVGTEDHPMQIGLQVTNSKTVQGMDYFMSVEIEYVEDVVTPYRPYAVQVPENATSLIVTSEKVGGSEHIDAEVLVVGPDDELVDQFEYNDIAIPTESKRIPVNQPGEYVVYIQDIEGGFLGVESDVPIPKDQRQILPLERVNETVTDASSPAPGSGGYCVPSVTGGNCTTQLPRGGGGSTQFAVNGTFPLEVTGWINQEGEANMNLNAEIVISSSEGQVFRMDKFAQYEDSRGTLGMTRDELHTTTAFENLALGEYTVEYVIDGSASVGHEVITYKR